MTHILINFHQWHSQCTQDYWGSFAVGFDVDSQSNRSKGRYFVISISTYVYHISKFSWSWKAFRPLAAKLNTWTIVKTNIGTSIVYLKVLNTCLWVLISKCIVWNDWQCVDMSIRGSNTNTIVVVVALY